MSTFKITKLTKQRLEAVRDSILRWPEKLDMGSWIGENDAAPVPTKCNTTACLAGWYAIQLPPEKRKGLKAAQAWKPLAQALKLKVTQTSWGGYAGHDEHLFDCIVQVDSWPEPFRGAYQDALNDHAIYTAAGIAAQRITYLIEQGE